MQTGAILTLWMCGVLFGPGSQAQDCGIAPLNSKVVGGETAKAGSWPWQVSIHIGIHLCGGTLINNQWVLTAAHCSTANASAYTLYLGRQSQTGFNENEVNRSVSRIIVHPNYNNTLFNNDIALMKLSSPVNFNDYIRPVCLASRNSNFPKGTLCWSTGWGRLLGNGSLPPELQEDEMNVITNPQCAIKYPPEKDAKITDEMICAGIAHNEICQADSGGPLQCKQDSHWIQGGITSFGVGCLFSMPEVYARVSEFQDWITENANDTSVEFVLFSSGDSAVITSTFKSMIVATAATVFLKLI